MERVLIIEDNQTMRQGMEKTLKKAGFKITSAASGGDGLEMLQQQEPHCVISDLKMSEMDGIEVMQKIHQRNAQIPVMIITAFGTIEKAVEAMKLGACDFITKPFPPELLRVKVKQALEISRLNREKDQLFHENQYLKAQAEDRYAGREILGKSAAIRKVHEQINKVAQTDTTVFITGESGTGKELVARAIHLTSPRCQSPFIKVNCSALATGVLESELFGHEKGAFTGAVRKKPGRFELAAQGTLFLDEIGDLDPSIQLKLLRVLQEKEFERVGGTRTLKVDVRIISATNQDLKQRVAEGLFREDLYYRLVIFPIELPPLRERSEDTALLAEAFLQRLNSKHHRGKKTVSRKALQLLRHYTWPGNIRELENVLEQAYILSDDNRLDVDNFPTFLKNSPTDGKIEAVLGTTPLPTILETTERRLIEAAYKQTGGVKTRMAKLLGIKTSALYYKLEKFGLLESGRQREA